jgi:aspartyl-tRNA(Asn)/glutamyl-tRNA(Gln) amidotransferase subunit B
MEYEIVIGLEVHAELSTNTKIYCSCKNSFGNEVNSNCCPICTGMPGTLPTLNKKVVEYAVKMGLALNCNINQISKQDRKNYFYPDLPKAYQISQFDIPLCQNGYVDVLVGGIEHGSIEHCSREKRIGVTRIHIEEDAGKLLHDDSFSGSLVDFNRCGVPLIEIVSEPDMRSSSEAKAYLDTIKAILQTLDISDCKMQEGSIRCDVNVSVRPKGSKKFGTRCEMKNVNSFNGAVHAIEYEAARQIEELEKGGIIKQETRRWDDAKGMSFLLRSKEDAHDYRYFPEPDLRTIVIEDEYLNNIKQSIPELPNKKLLRLMNQYNIPEFDAGLIAINSERAAFFESCAALEKALPKNIANWLLGDIIRILSEKNMELSGLPFTAKNLVRLVELIETGTISNTAGKTVIEEMFEGKLPDDIVKEKGLAQISDENALEAVVKQVLEANPKSVADYKSGKTNAAGFLVGQCMKLTKGQGNPQILKDILLRLIEE